VSNTDIRVELGFEGGATTVATIDQKSWTELQKALEGKADGWVMVPARDDTELRVRIGSIQYARSAATARSVGF
jgi:hypothetical protein